jgi:ammonium transporter, Amt family
MYAVKATKTLRVSEAGELEGIDIHEHGTPAYHPEFAFMSITLPAGSDGRVPEDEHHPHEGH